MASARCSRTKSHMGTPSALVTAYPSFGSVVSVPVLVNRQPPLIGVPTQSNARKAVTGPASIRLAAAMAARQSCTRSHRVARRRIGDSLMVAINRPLQLVSALQLHGRPASKDEDVALPNVSPSGMARAIHRLI